MNTVSMSYKSLRNLSNAELYEIIGNSQYCKQTQKNASAILLERGVHG